MKVYTIIVTYNGSKWIRKCLNSLVNSTYYTSIIVIDNASQDTTPDLLQEYGERIEYIPLSENVGFGQANNLGLQQGLEKGADYLFLLNQDAWVEPETLGKLIELHQDNQEFGILSPMHLNAERLALDYNFSRYISAEHCPGLISDLYLDRLSSVYEIDFVNAAAWLMTRACLEKVGLFDPVFFHYGEDRNYCQRALYHGKKIGICPGVTIIHDRGDRKGTRTEYAGDKEARRLTLVEFCDIGKPFSRKYVRFLIVETFNGLFNGISFQFIKARKCFSDLFYFLKMKKAILESRSRNLHPSLSKKN